jgi:DNA-binding transcriptional LysR family regulator
VESTIASGVLTPFQIPLNFGSLRTYLRAETLNFTRAAQRLFLAQPSLSKQISDLEIEIKFPLFERSRDGIRITDAGRIVIAYARNTLRERDEMLAMARAVHLGDVPPLRLGFSSFINANLLQVFRESYEEMSPDARFNWLAEIRC